MLKTPVSFVLASLRELSGQQRVRFVPSLAAALLNERFEHPAKTYQ
jgi:hypothetical protein